MLEKIASRSATEKLYDKGPVHFEDVSIENLWTFVLGVEKGLEFPVGFIRRETFHQQTHFNDTFYQPSFSIAQCNKCTENFPDVGINCV